MQLKIVFSGEGTSGVCPAFSPKGDVYNMERKNTDTIKSLFRQAKELQDAATAMTQVLQRAFPELTKGRASRQREPERQEPERRVRNEMTLIEAMKSVMGDSAMSAQEVVEALQEAGHQISSKDPVGYVRGIFSGVKDREKNRVFLPSSERRKFIVAPVKARKENDLHVTH